MLHILGDCAVSPWLALPNLTSSPVDRETEVVFHVVEQDRVVLSGFYRRHMRRLCCLAVVNIIGMQTPSLI